MRTVRASPGFTLVELLVALVVMALIAILSWRGLDGMARAQAATQARAEQVLTLQTGLAQWAADLDALVQLPQITALDWNGRVLRLTRRAPSGPGAGVVVVAWGRRAVEGNGMWLRWQSPPLASRGEVAQAWQRADLWSQNPGDEDRLREVAVAPLDEWQIYFFRGDTWTNPLSSDTVAPAGPGARTPPRPDGAQAPAAPAAATTAVAVMPDGVRLVLSLSAGQAISGRLTRDWLRPTVGGGKS